MTAPRVPALALAALAALTPIAAPREFGGRSRPKPKTSAGAKRIRKNKAARKSRRRNRG